jgi:hypothetical protein
MCGKADRWDGAAGGVKVDPQSGPCPVDTVLGDRQVLVAGMVDPSALGSSALALARVGTTGAISKERP